MDRRELIEPHMAMDDQIDLSRLPPLALAELRELVERGETAINDSDLPFLRQVIHAVFELLEEEAGDTDLPEELGRRRQVVMDSASDDLSAAEEILELLRQEMN